MVPPIPGKDKAYSDPCKNDCWTPPPSPSPSSHGRARFVTGLIIAGSALAVLTICIFLLLLIRRRRQQQQRRRREALLEAALAPAAPAATPDDDVEEAAEQEQGEVVHHAWLIRTVGLDEAAIESIALTRYRAGAAGAVGASDCAVCLGEFSDGELLRVLPRCAHAFHVHCIDTWLRAHVNCPLCRSHVLEPPPVPAAEQSESPVAGADDDTGQAAVEETGHEQEQQQEGGQGELRLQIDHDQQHSPDEHPSARGGNFRRVASMNSPSPIASAEETPREAGDEQAGGGKQGTGGAVHFEVLSPGGSSSSPENQSGMKRSLSVGSRWALVSRHCRRSSSLLPF